MNKKYIYLSAVLLSVMSLTVSASDIEMTLDASRLEIIPDSLDSHNSVGISLWSINAGRVLATAKLTSVSTLKKVYGPPSPFALEHPQFTKIVGSSTFSGDEHPDLDSYDLSKMNIQIGVMGEEKSFLLEDPTCSLLLNTLYPYEYTISLAGKIDLNNLSGSTKNVKCEISRDVPVYSDTNDQPDYTKTVIEGANYLVPITYDFSGIKASPEDSQALSKLQTDYKIVYFMADQKAVTAATAGYSASRLYEQADNKRLVDIHLDELKKVVRRDILVMDEKYNVMFPIALYTLKGSANEGVSDGLVRSADALEKMNGNIVDSCNNIRITPKDGGSRIKFNGMLHAPDAANGKLEPFIDNISCELVPPLPSSLSE